jgi:hypothetical protein
MIWICSGLSTSAAVISLIKSFMSIIPSSCVIRFTVKCHSNFSALLLCVIADFILLDLQILSRRMNGKICW